MVKATLTQLTLFLLGMMGLANHAPIIGGAIDGQIDPVVTQAPLKEIDASSKIFAFTDDNIGEDIIIHAETEKVQTLSKAAFKIAVTNNSIVDQNISVQSYFKTSKKKIESISLITDVKTNWATTTVPTYTIGKDGLPIVSGTKEVVTYKNVRQAKTLVASKTAPINAKPSAQYADKSASVFVKTGETIYLELVLDVTADTFTSFTPPEEFFIEAIGDQGGYGHLDPTIAYNQSCSGTNISADATCTFASGLTLGSVITVLTSDYNTSQTLLTVTDTCSNNYTILDNAQFHGSITTAQAYTVVTTPGSCVITATWDGGVIFNVVAHEITGADTVSPIDGHKITASEGSGTDQASSGNITTAANGDYIFGAESDLSETANAGTGFTLRTLVENILNSYTEDLIQTSAGSIAATFTLSGGSYWGTGIIAVKQATAAAASLVRPTTLQDWDDF